MGASQGIQKLMWPFSKHYNALLNGAKQTDILLVRDGIVKSVPHVHHLPSLWKPWEAFFYPTLTLMIDVILCLFVCLFV